MICRGFVPLLFSFLTVKMQDFGIMKIIRESKERIRMKDRSSEDQPEPAIQPISM